MWRRLSGKEKTKAEEKGVREAKERKMIETKARPGNEGDLGTVEVYHSLNHAKEDDGVIR